MKVITCSVLFVILFNFINCGRKDRVHIKIHVPKLYNHQHQTRLVILHKPNHNRYRTKVYPRLPKLQTIRRLPIKTNVIHHHHVHYLPSPQFVKGQIGVPKYRNYLHRYRHDYVAHGNGIRNLPLKQIVTHNDIIQKSLQLISDDVKSIPIKPDAGYQVTENLNENMEPYTKHYEEYGKKFGEETEYSKEFKSVGDEFIDESSEDKLANKETEHSDEVEEMKKNINYDKLETF